MAVSAVDLTIHTHTDFVQVLNLTNDDDSVFDLTGYTAESKIRNGPEFVFVDAGGVSFTANITDAADGEITLSLTDTVTGGFTHTGTRLGASLPKWDLVIIDGSSVRTKVAEGTVTIKDTQTRT